MSVGEGAQSGVKSYVALFIEASFGTFPATAATGASTLEFTSLGFKTEIQKEKLDQISQNRGFTKQVALDKSVGGTLEQYLHPTESLRLLTNALGGGVVSTGTTLTYFTHSITAGDFNSTVPSLSVQARKGDTHHWRYSGGRINVLKISGSVGEVVKCSYDFIFKDSTQAGSDISGSLSISSLLPFTYVQGTYQYAGSEASFTTSAQEYIRSFELTVNNNLVNDDNVRSLGSNVLQTLPPTRREIEFKVTQRFDTTSTWDKFITNTQGAIRLYFEGATITGTSMYSCEIRLPKVYVRTGDLEVGDASEILMNEIDFDVLVDNPGTTTGKDIGITIVNNVASV